LFSGQAFDVFDEQEIPMRSWLSFRTGIPGVRLGVALPTSSRSVPVSGTGVKVLGGEA
jgi:hypothetical protein